MHARTLIEAIQSLRPERLAQVIADLERQADLEVASLDPIERAWKRRNLVNDVLPGLGLTALHVAARAYVAHRNPQDMKLARVFNNMVRQLLTAGANPAIAIGTTYKKQVVAGHTVFTIDNPGRTVAEVCEGKLPPSLKRWFAATVNDNSTAPATNRQETHRNSPNWEQVERRRERMKKKREREKARRLATA